MVGQMGDDANVAKQRKPKIFYGWYLVYGQIILSLIAGAALFYGFPAFLKFILDEYGWSTASTSLVYGITTLEGGVLAPVYGWLVYRYGLRRPMAFATSIALIGFIVLYHLDSLVDFYVGFILVGLGFGVYHVAPLTAITNWFRVKRSMAMGIVMVGSGLGGVLVPVVLWAAQTYGWRFSFALCAMAVALVCLPLCLLFRTRPEPYGLTMDGIPEQAMHDEPSPDTPADDRTYQAGDVIRTWQFWGVVAVTAVGWLPFSAIVPHLFIYLSERNISPELAAITITAMSVCGLAARAFVGWLGDRMNRYRLIVYELIAMSLATLWFGFISQDWQLIVFIPVFALGVGGLAVSVPLLVGDQYGARAFPLMIGLVMLPPSLLWFAAPGLAGWVFDAFATYRPAWLILGALTFLTVPVAYHLRQKAAARG